jgi:hypothetical protein
LFSAPGVLSSVTPPRALVFNPLSQHRDTLPLTLERRAVESWITLKEAGNLLGVSAAAIRYRALKKGMYKHRREQREYGETVVVSTQSLIEKHPELKEKLGDDLKLPAKEDASIPSYKTQGVSMVPPPEGGPRFVTEKSSLEVRAEVVDTDRLRTLLDELEEVRKREEEIKREMKELLR